MKVTIFGAGAIGGFIGTRLALEGHDVSAVARGATAAALREHGWRLEVAGERFSAPARVGTPRELGAQDLVVVAVKGPAMGDVAGAIAPLLGPDTMVLVAMNGVPWWFFDGLPGRTEGLRLTTIDPDGRIAVAIPGRHIIGCVVHATCSTPEPGLVRHGFGHKLILGEPDGSLSPRVRELAEALAAAGFEAPVSPRIQAEIWYKLWGNMTMNPMSALTGATCDRILDDPLLHRFCLKVMDEAAAIGAEIGCPIAQSGAERIAVTRQLGAFKTSMLQDVEAGKALEIDALVTAVQEIGRHVGVPTPETDTLLGFVRLFGQVRGLYS
jgi:2-dehydropantoate 2-reductase